MCILGVGRQTAQQIISDGVSMLYLGLPREVAFEPENVQPWEPLVYILWRFISTFQQSAWENKTYYWEQRSSWEWRYFHNSGLQNRQEQTMSFTCMPKPVCSQSWDSSTTHKQLSASNDTQMLSTGDFFTKQRKYLWCNTHCLQVVGYHSLCDAVNLWKTIKEGKFYGNYVHSQSWLVSNQI